MEMEKQTIKNERENGKSKGDIEKERKQGEKDVGGYI